MSGSFESVRWNACVHRLDLGLYSHPKEFLGNGVRTRVNSKGKITSTGGAEEDRTRSPTLSTTASPTQYQLSDSGPLDASKDWHGTRGEFRNTETEERASGF